MAESNQLKAGWSTVAILNAFRDLALVLALRWRSIRSFRVKVGMGVGLYLLAIALGLSLNTGILFADLATYANTEQSALARAWLNDVLIGNYGLLSLGVVGTALGIILLAPFTGASSLTLIDDDSAMPHSFTRGRRFLDSVVFSMISGVGIIHLIVSVMVASIISVDGSRFWGILIATLLWVGFLSTASLFGWIVETLVGVFGKKLKWAYGAALAGSGYLIYSSTDLQTTLEGFATYYGDLIRLAASVSLTEAATTFFLTVSAVVLIMIAGFYLARTWDGLSPNRKFNMSAGKKVYRRKKPINAISFLIVALWRTREVKRTVIAVTVAGVVSTVYFFPTAPDSILGGISVGIPVVSTLIWSSNAFGVVGAGATWLFSQPYLKTRAIVAVQLLTFGQSIILGVFFILPVVLIHNELFLESLNTQIYALILNSLLLSAFGVLMSIIRPHTVRLAGKGESILPPTSSISYLLNFGVIAALNAVALNVTSSYIILFALYTGLILLLSVLTIVIVNIVWSVPKYQKRVISTVTGD